MIAPAAVSLRDEWMAQWPAALAVWSPFIRLRPPTLCETVEEARSHELTGSFAMIRLVDQSVFVSLPGVVEHNLQDHAVEVLAHEIGHHVLAPATPSEHARMIARMRRALPTVERWAPMVANLYTDLLINDRLQRRGLRMADIYRELAESGEGSALWRFYMRVYEVLWSLEAGSLTGSSVADSTEGDAWLAARLVRSYALDQLGGSKPFAALVLPYLLEDKRIGQALARLFDTETAARGADPAGLSEGEPDDRGPRGQAAGQTREPFEYGEILRAAGLSLDDHDVAIRYYRERALPHLVRYPSRPLPRRTDAVPEGLEPWDVGQPLDEVDWLQSVLVSPVVIPGVTTVRRVWGPGEELPPARQALDLDLYVDSSGSMVNPQHGLSFPALAGAIICLSALRAGARVQVTLWSGADEFLSTPGFVRDERSALAVLTGHFGGGTAFPIHKLRDTFAGRRPDQRPVHILVISDDGVTTMFDEDERGGSGWDVAALALAKGRGGGTLVLNLPGAWESGDDVLARDLRRAQEQGWRVHRVTDWDELVAFAGAFSKSTFLGEEK